MNLTSVMAELRSKGNANTAKIYRRHGVAEKTCGLPYADLGKLVKKIQTNHELALELWDTGLHDARVLATKIASPERMSKRAITRWLGQCKNYVVTDATAGLAARMPDAAELAEQWTAQNGEWTSAAGWNVYAILATDGKLDRRAAKTLIRRIQKEIHSARNRTRHAMNNTLIAVGGAMPELREEAIRAARAIGVVEVDHGETGCKTPAAEPYILRMAARAKPLERYPLKGTPSKK